MDKIKCVYAIIGHHNANDDNKIKPEIQGLDNTEIYTISFKNISAVVGNINRNKIVIDKEHAIDYARVIEELTTNYTLLPMRYGTLIETEDSIYKLLKENYDKYLQNLLNVDNKYEFGLKVLWDYEKHSLKIRSKAETENYGTGDVFRNSTPHKNYLLKKLKEHRFEESLLNHAEQIIGNINRQLVPLSSANKLNKKATKNILLDAVYLLEKNKKIDFINKITQLKKQYENIDFLLTGPWPPYNFIEINIK